MTDHLAVLEELAILLWHRFAPDDHIEWEDETHKAEYRDVAEAAIALMREQSWQDIATAPKDRAHILAWFPTCKCSFTVVWMYDAWCFAGAGLVPYGAPTLWMPVPTPPKEPADEQ